ncbi:hypothetical protein D3C77_374950 [compost metagenome]
MIGKLDVIGVSDIVKVRVQLAFSRRTRIQITQCSRGGIPRVLKRFGGSLVVFGQNGQIHNALSLNLDRPLAVGDRQRHRLDRLDLGENPFTNYAIPPSRCLNELSVGISEIQRQPVELKLDHIGRGGERGVRIFTIIVPDQTKYSIVPVHQMLLRLRFVQTPKRR